MTPKRILPLYMVRDLDGLYLNWRHNHYSRWEGIDKAEVFHSHTEANDSGHAAFLWEAGAEAHFEIVTLEATETESSPGDPT